MSQDIISDGLNKMMNALRSGKNSATLKSHSKLLVSILAIAKLRGYVKHYEVNGRELKVEFGKLNCCKSIKPRFIVKADDVQSYAKRYLPARDLGVIIVSTSQGLMTHQTAQEKKIGGCLLAYFY